MSNSLLALCDGIRGPFIRKEVWVLTEVYELSLGAWNLGRRLR